jgi:predicted RNA-binding Zn-ribbon protein involved in translation (DUF1610 family)
MRFHGKDMSRSSTSEFSCPSCGAAAAVWFPNTDPQLQDVTLKCVSCATLMRLPKDKVVGAGSSGPQGAFGSSEVSSTL